MNATHENQNGLAIGVRIREARLRAGLTMSQLADRIAAHASQVSRYERGTRYLGPQDARHRRCARREL
ncbi:helix-turn-helix transcriptional regulator [Stenotrophomonas maltophilia]|nr:helix-turn-helix transcriptional regulator [Stenotrophomonas maltophilia]